MRFLPVRRGGGAGVRNASDAEVASQGHERNWEYYLQKMNKRQEEGKGVISLPPRNQETAIRETLTNTILLYLHTILMAKELLGCKGFRWPAIRAYIPVI